MFCSFFSNQIQVLLFSEQLKSWQDSITNKESSENRSDGVRKVKFTDSCVFLAACASGDQQEVGRLLDQGADVNTTNVDGMTALHQVGYVSYPSNHSYLFLPPVLGVGGCIS